MYRHLFAVLLSSMAFDLQLQAQEYNEGAPISELNVGGQADAYPWISADGLRIYYTKEVGGLNKAYAAERPDLVTPFGTPTNFIDVLIDVHSVWLSPDELQVWYLDMNGGLNRATRPDLVTPFSPGTAVTLSPNPGGGSAPTLTPDENELYISQWNGVQRYDRTGVDQYTLVGMIDLGFAYPFPMHLDPTGLHAYFAVNLGPEDFVLYRASRSQLGQPFQSAQLLTGTALIGVPLHAAHVTPDGSLLVATTIGQGSGWQSNDLFEATGTLNVGLEELQDIAGALCWPLPAEHELMVALPKAEGPFTIRLFDADGRCVLNDRGAAQEIVQLNVARLPSGVYALAIDANGTSIRRKVVVSH